MASRLVKVSEDDSLAANKAVVPIDNKKATKFSLSVFTDG